MMKILLSLLLAALPIAAKEKAESFYRDAWAKRNGGKTEVRLPDGTRADVITKTHAVEVDFAEKWAEAFGQALWYSFQTNKKPGIVLILRKEEDRRNLFRIQSLAAHHKIEIDTWVISL